MHSHKVTKRPESITIFVSLALSLLVFFSYLNALSVPSKALLLRAVPKQPQNETPMLTDALVPDSLQKLVLFSTKKTSPNTEFPQTESLFIIDKRKLNDITHSGKAYKTELSNWFNELEGSNLHIEISCFIQAEPMPGEEVAQQLQRHEVACEKIFSKVEPPLSPRITFITQHTPTSITSRLISFQVQAADVLFIRLTQSHEVV